MLEKFVENVRPQLFYRKLAHIFSPFLSHRHGEKWIQKIGYRSYVGGYWESLGWLQFQFMLSKGLRPQHVFLDIGCGALRAGRYFIPYLERGHYLGIEKEMLLIQNGIEKELENGNFQAKGPEIIHSSTFEFHKLSKTPHFALAHSVFTHLTSSDIQRCLQRLRANTATGFRLYASFFEGKHSSSNIRNSHDHFAFYYSFEEMEKTAQVYGWKTTYLGECYLSRGQKMLEFNAF